MHLFNRSKHKWYLIQGDYLIYGGCKPILISLKVRIIFSDRKRDRGREGGKAQLLPNPMRNIIYPDDWVFF